MLGWDFPASWYQSLNPVFIMALAPVFAWVWLALNRRGQEPSTIVKFSLGLVLVGASFFLFLVPLSHGRRRHKVSPMWLVAIYFIQTVGELCLSPVGLSVTTKMAPAKYASPDDGRLVPRRHRGRRHRPACCPSPASTSTGRGVVALEATLAVLAGFAVWMYRSKVKALMGDVR